MERRRFLGHVMLGSAAAAMWGGTGVAARQASLRIKFVGMMGYVSRTDGSILVAMPGHHPSGHYHHVPFLMAQAGSPIAAALGMTAMPGVAASAFDDRIGNIPDSAFVFRCLEGCDIDVRIDDAAGAVAVANRATHLAQMYKIAGGKRLRNDLRRWSNATVTLQGGRLDNSAAHPDAGRTWSFGTHSQPLTDATLYSAEGATLRLSAGRRVETFSTASAGGADLWVVSAAGPRSDVPDPKRLEHGAILFHYFADAEPVTATCEEAQGRVTLATELPCSSGGVASRAGAASRMAPPHADLCYGGGWCDDPDGCV